MPREKEKSPNILRLNIYLAILKIIHPWVCLPLTQIYYDLLENGVCSKYYWDDFFKKRTRDYNVRPFRPIELQNELSDMKNDAYRKFYLSPSFIINDLKRKTSFMMLKLKVILAFKLLFVETKKNHNKHLAATYFFVIFELALKITTILQHDSFKNITNFLSQIELLSYQNVNHKVLLAQSKSSILILQTGQISHV